MKCEKMTEFEEKVVRKLAKVEFNLAVEKVKKAIKSHKLGRSRHEIHVFVTSKRLSKALGYSPVKNGFLTVNRTLSRLERKGVVKSTMTVYGKSWSIDKFWALSHNK